VTGSIEDPRAVTLEQLSLTVRCYDPPKREGINTVGQLAVLPERHLTGLRGFTPEAMGELKYKLRQLGLSPWAAPQPAGNQGGSGTAG
jgi:DNA-directed RNA polymerase alpha subunit